MLERVSEVLGLLGSRSEAACRKVEKNTVGIERRRYLYARQQLSVEGHAAVSCTTT